jgi:hypothetical protein
VSRLLLSVPTMAAARPAVLQAALRAPQRPVGPVLPRAPVSPAKYSGLTSDRIQLR